MRITEKYLIDLGKTLTERFPTLHLGTRGFGWGIHRRTPDNARMVNFVSELLETNREAMQWMDGFHKGADEREQEIRAAIGKLFADYEQDGDIGKMLAMLTTWMPQ